MICVVPAACGLRTPPVAAPSPPSICAPAGRWIDPGTGFAIPFPDVVRRAVGSRVVLLGEDHDRPGQHRWQLYVAAAIAGAAADVRLGFEMFPRRLQPALDRWVAGTIDEPTFLTESEWRTVWGFDAGLYRPLLRFARTARIPMRALNVDRSLVRRVREQGWIAVPAGEREGLSTPAPASAAYRARLAETWRAHQPGGAPGDESALDRFVEAQLVWDQAMATALRSAAAEGPDVVVVGIVGRGHVEPGAGIPAQLVAAGGPRPLVLLPWEPARPCAELAPGVADFVFGLDDPWSAPDNSDGT